MIREEAKAVFLNRGYIEVEGGTIYDADKWREACVVISEWLELQPCDDAISRQAVLNIITEQERLASDRVRDTPSSLGNGLHTWINPAYTKYSAQLSERSQFKTMIQTMPPVTPQQKTGYISIDDVMSVFDDFMCGEVDEDGTDTFLEMLKDKAESEGQYVKEMCNTNYK